MAKYLAYSKNVFVYLSKTVPYNACMWINKFNSFRQIQQAKFWVKSVLIAASQG